MPCLSSGTGISRMASSFDASGFTPSPVRRCPMYVTLVHLILHLSGFSLRFLCLTRCNTSLIFRRVLLPSFPKLRCHRCQSRHREGHGTVRVTSCETLLGRCEYRKANEYNAICQTVLQRLLALNSLHLEKFAKNPSWHLGLRNTLLHSALS